MKIKKYNPGSLIGSGWTFAVTILLFVLETGYLALTSRFPMAYDEGYHFGLIRFFAHRLNPFITTQAADTYKLGPLVHNPPFLYHYLLSFIYRFVGLFSHSTEIQVICLRFANSMLAVIGLVIMRKLLRVIGVPRALTNVIVLIFALTPMMTTVSAQINYDNMLLPATGLCLYVTIVFVQKLDKNRFDTKSFLLLLSLCLFSSLIKFAFLPIFAAIAAIIFWKVVRRRKKIPQLMDSARKSFKALGAGARFGLLFACLAGIALFVWFYGINTVDYGTPVPSCTQSLSAQKCQHYAPWAYLHQAQTYYHSHNRPDPSNIGWYAAWWTQENFYELFSTQMPLNGTPYTAETYLLIVMIITITALVAAVVHIREIVHQNSDLMLLLAIAAVYVACLFLKNYHDFLQVGIPLAIHGRYLLPILIYLYALLALALRAAFGRKKAMTAAKAPLALAVMLTFVYYGGFYGYIRYIDPSYGRLDTSNNFSVHDGTTDN